MYTDMMFHKVKSLHGNKCAQIFCTDFEWCHAFPLPKKSQAHEALTIIHQHFGAPAKMIADNAPKLSEGKFVRKSKHAGTDLTTVKPYTQEHNHAELVNHELRHGYKREMMRMNAPVVLWDHCLELRAQI